MALLAAAVVLAPSETTQQIRTADIDVDTVAAAAKGGNKDRDKAKTNGKWCEAGTGCGEAKNQGKGVLRVTGADDTPVDTTVDSAVDTLADTTDDTTDDSAVDTPADTSVDTADGVGEPTDGVSDTTASDTETTVASQTATTSPDAETTVGPTNTVTSDGGGDDTATSGGSVDQTTTSIQATTAEQQATTTLATTTQVASTQATTTESTATTTTSPGGDDRSCCAEGYAGVHVDASSSFDKWTKGDEYWPFINANYDSMMVYASYWDSRLEHYDKVIVYRDVYAVYVDSDRAIEHPEWILRERDGSPVYIPWGCSNGCPQYAADVSNPEFRQDFIGTLKDLVGRGYPGIMLDDVNMSWRFSDRNGNDAEPIDPATGQTMTLTAWQTYLVEFVEEIRRELPGVTIAHNPIWYVDSPDFDNQLIDRQIRAADLIQLERGATDGGLVDGTGRYGFQTFLNYVDRVHRAGGQVLLLDEDAESEDDLIFNLAATLLINNGGDLVSTENWDFISPVSFWDGFKTDLGHALGSRYLDDGLIRRDFTGGTVLLNEPDAAPVRVNLSQPMRLLNGQQVTSFVLDGREAAILSPD